MGVLVTALRLSSTPSDGNDLGSVLEGTRSLLFGA